MSQFMFYAVGNERYLMKLSSIGEHHVVNGFSFQEGLTQLFGDNLYGLLLRVQRFCPQRPDSTKQEYQADLLDVINTDTDLLFILGFDNDDLIRFTPQEEQLFKQVQKQCADLVFSL